MAMRALVSFLAAIALLVVIWSLGGPVGAWLNAPGLLLLRAAGALGLFAARRDPTLREWLWLGTALSAVVWWLVAYAALALVGRRRHGTEGHADRRGGGE